MGLKSKLSREQVDEMVRLRNAGQTLSYLSKSYGLSMGRISQICTKHNKERIAASHVKASDPDSDEDPVLI